MGEERWCCWWGLRVVDQVLDGQSFLMDRVYVDLCSMGYELKALNMHNSMVVDPQTVLDFCFMGYEPLTNSSSKWQRLTIVTPKSYHLSPLSKRWICSTTTTQDDIKQGTDRLFFDFCFMSYEPITTSSSKWQRLAIVIPKSYHLSSSS